MSQPITVLLADDHSLVRDTLAGWLGRTGEFRVVSGVGSADDAVAEAIRLKPDVILMDIDMPGRSCFDAARTIKARVEDVSLIFLSAFSHDRYIQEALAVEAAGYLTKSEPPEVVSRAIRSVVGGGVYFSEEVQERVIIDEKGARLGGDGKTRASLLTPRELEVLRYIARGMSKKEAAGIMHVSVKTVDHHCASLMNKLDIHDRVELARFAIREGLAEA